MLRRGGLLESDEAPGVFIPERQSKRRKALPQRDDGRTMENRVLLVTLLQVVVRNARAEVMDVVIADAPRHPSQERRQREVRASCDRRRAIIPVLVFLPVRSFELMLHEKEPEAGHHRDVVGRQVAQRHAWAEEGEEPAANDEDTGIGPPDTANLPLSRVGTARRKALVENE